MHDRAALLGALTAVLNGPRKDEGDNGKIDKLQVWHDALRRKYLEKPSIERSEILLCNSQFSYAISTSSSETLDPAQMVQILTEVNKETVDRVNTGWSMFFPFGRQPISPYLSSDHLAGTGDDEFLEADLTLDDKKPDKDADMWRVSRSGMASLIRPIRLDYLQHGEWSATNFSVNEAARNVGQLVRHAQGLSERFAAPLEVSFICEWQGLSGRELADPNAHWSPGRIARTNTRKTQGSWSVGELNSNWPTIVAELIAPLVRAFDPNLVLTKEWVISDAMSWRPIGGQWP